MSIDSLIIEDEKQKHKNENELVGYVKILSFSCFALFLIALLSSMHFARPVIFPVVLAVFLNLLLSPAVRYLKWYRISNSVSAFLILIFFMLSFGFVINNLIEPASNWIQRTPQTLALVESKIGFMKKSMQEISKVTEKISKATDLTSLKKEKVVVQESNFIGSALFFAGVSVSEIIISIILTFFLLSNGDRFLTKSVELMPRLSDKKKVVEIARSIEQSISIYLLSVTMINIILGLAITLLMWTLGVPNAPLWGMMACILNFIPYLGSIIGLVIISIVSIVTFDNTFQIILPPLLYASIDWAEGSILTPSVIGARLDLNPPVMLFWVLFWGWLWGPWGAVLAVPMLTAIKIFCDKIEALKPLGKFLVT